MWNENDTMMALVEDIEQGRITSPAKCPVCNKNHAHFLMHKANETTGRGTAWIWCDDCKNYSHFAYFVPDWWRNPSFIDMGKLNSNVEYPHSIEDEIDEWIKALVK